MTQPIEERYREQLTLLGDAISSYLNPRGTETKTGFVLLMFETGEPNGSRMNYLSNCNREDMILALEELLVNMKGGASV